MVFTMSYQEDELEFSTSSKEQWSFVYIIVCFGTTLNDGVAIKEGRGQPRTAVYRSRSKWVISEILGPSM